LSLLVNIGGASINKYHMLECKEVLKELKSSEFGLDAKEVEKRHNIYKPNLIVEAKKISKWKKFLRQFSDALVIILLIAAMITAVLKPYEIDWLVIIAIVFITATIGYFQEEKAEEAIDKLKNLAAPKTIVIRSGRRHELLASELLPGDIVYLESGMRIPADGRVIKSYALKVNEAALTGESVPEDKISNALSEDVSLADRVNMVYMSTVVEAGRGLVVVTATGMETEIGHIADLIQKVERIETPLQKKLKNLGKKLGILVLAVCILIFTIEIIRYYNALSIEHFIELFETSVSLAVAAIPEGLPAVVTIGLAIGIKMMASKNVIIRKLPVVETLGSATVICTDKTGTLTTGTMIADFLYTNNDKFEIEGTGIIPIGRFIKEGRVINLDQESESFKQVMLASILCSDATFSDYNDGRKILGDTTEGAIIVMAEKVGYDYRKIREEYPRLTEHAFDSNRRMMSTVHNINEVKIAYTKGAPEKVLEVCTGELINSNYYHLSEPRKKYLLGITEDLAQSGYRTLAFSFHPQGIIEQDMTFLGIVGIRDKIRPEAKDAVAKTKHAGIRVVLITGDHKLTATTIGKEIGLITGDYQAINCHELDNIDDKEFNKILDRVSVFARASPEHKVRIIKGLKASGHIVAMTGDGVNDAPALKLADIGVSMGITGTDVAKEASDMIITDDNFTSIVAAIEEGRGIYDNIRKVIQFLLSCNIGEVSLILLAVILGLPLPLIALQILWMNLVTDSFPALALNTEPKEPGLMQRRPRNPSESAITKDMVISIIVSAIIITIGTIFVFLHTLPHGIDYARTMAFTTMVMFQMWISIACRSTTHTMSEIGWFSNPRLLGAITLAVLLMLPVIYLPQAQDIFGTIALNSYDWLVIIIISFTGLFAVEVWEWVNRRYLNYSMGGN